MNASGIIQSASDSVEQVFGWKPAELQGRNVKILIPEPRRSALEQYLDRYRHTDRTRSPNRMRRFDALRKDGTVFPIELSMSRADLPSHATPFFIGILRDVSHQIDVGADSDDERHRLQQLLNEQTRALGTLVAGLGHDMNSVLFPVRARLNALAHAGVSEAAMKHIAAVRQSIAYLQHLSDGLHFLAIDPDTVGDDGHAETDLPAWWKQTSSLFSKLVPKHVKLVASFPAGLPNVRISHHWLTQAMLNLVVNAGESIPSTRRGGRVHVSAVPGKDGGTVRIRVVDNGRGMSAGIARRAFDLFFTTKSRGMGTGLGLPLARKVALRAGGDIELESTPGQGTTSTLTLLAAARGANGRKVPSYPQRTATVSMPNTRTAALIAQILIGAGVLALPQARQMPGNTDLWITAPTDAALRIAGAWQAARAGRKVIVLGTPSARARARWQAITSSIVDPPDNFEALRDALAPSPAPTPTANGGGSKTGKPRSGSTKRSRPAPRRKAKTS